MAKLTDRSLVTNTAGNDLLHIVDISNTTDSPQGTSFKTERKTITEVIGVVPEDYGAVGNGVTDDTTALQNALNAAATKRVPLVIPAKTYIVSDSLLLPSNSSIIGVNKYSSIIKADNDDSPINIKVLRNDNFSTGNVNISIKNITVDGNDIGFDDEDNGSVCIEIQKVSGLTLDNLNITKGGIEGTYIYLCNNVIVSNYTAYDNGPFASEVDYLGDAAGIHFDSCAHFQLNGCISRNNGFHGVICTSSQFGYIQATTYNNGFQGVFLQVGCSDITVDLNSYYNFRGIYITDSNRINVTGNIRQNTNGCLTRDALDVIFNVTSYDNIENDLYLVGGTDVVKWTGYPLTPVYTKEEVTSTLDIPIYDLSDYARKDQNNNFSTSQTTAGLISTDTVQATRYISTLTTLTGEAPLQVESTVRVDNLNASFLNGKTSFDFAQVNEENSFVGSQSIDGALYVSSLGVFENFLRLQGVQKPQLELRSTGTGIAHQGIIDFQDGTNTSQGYIGFDSSTNNNFEIYSAYTDKTFSLLTSGTMKYDGDISTSYSFISTVADGTAPLTVASTTLVANLNADLLRGVHWGNVDTDIITSGNITATGAINTGNSTISESGNMVISHNTGAGVILFRPVNAGSGTGQMSLNTSGVLTAIRLNLSGLPTAASGLSTGDVWRDGTDLKIVV